MSSPRERQRSPSNPDARRSIQQAQPFPHPPKPQVIKALKRIHTEETKTYKIYDHIEVEDSGGATKANCRLTTSETEIRNTTGYSAESCRGAAHGAGES